MTDTERKLYEILADIAGLTNSMIGRSIDPNIELIGNKAKEGMELITKNPNTFITRGDIPQDSILVLANIPNSSLFDVHLNIRNIKPGDTYIGYRGIDYNRSTPTTIKIFNSCEAIGDDIVKAIKNWWLDIFDNKGSLVNRTTDARIIRYSDGKCVDEFILNDVFPVYYEYNDGNIYIEFNLHSLRRS